MTRSIRSTRSPRPARSRWLGVLVPLAIVPVLAADIRSNVGTKQVSPRTTWDSVFSSVQAARGETAYAKTCARCHGASLSGGDESPALAGGAFLGNWNGLPLSDLQARIKTTMPSDTVGIYERQLVTDVIAFLLKANGFPAGQADLPVGVDTLKEIVIQAARP